MADPHSGSVFYEIAMLLVLAAGVGFIGFLLRQPLIVSFIAVGLLAGPSGLDIVHAEEQIELFAELGIVLLLFLVGLKLDVNLIRKLGPAALATGLGQVSATAALGFAACLALGLGMTESIYVAIALTFSSTIIIVKLLSDKRAIDSLYGRVSLGILIIQDLVVVIAMIVLSAISAGGEGDPRIAVAMVALNGALLVGGVGAFIRFVAEPLAERLAQSPELLVAFAIGWAALLGTSADVLGLSKELGGLLAGVSFASTRFREAMASRLSPLRDFLLLFFFIALGAGLDLSLAGGMLVTAIALSLFVLVGKPAIIFLIMSQMGYRKRSGFLAGVTLSQISEFSLIFMAMAVSIGHVGDEVIGLVTLVALITITASSYSITYAKSIYKIVEPILGPFERKAAAGSDEEENEQTLARKYDVLLFGLGRFGGAVAQRLKAQNMSVLGVDFNPSAVQRWRAEGVDAVYGDATDPEFISHLPLSGSRWAVSAVPEFDASLTADDARLSLIRTLKSQNYQGRIAVTCHREVDVEPLRAADADLVLLPFQDAADRAVELLFEGERPERMEVIEPDDQIELAS
ncbi:MAG: cation:proton antiporter [Pseudomonadota bacterium]